MPRPPADRQGGRNALSRRKRKRTSRQATRQLQETANEASVASTAERAEAAGLQKSPANRRDPTLVLSLAAACSLAAAWWIALAAMAFWTANPETLNRDQIHRARYVVTATISNLDDGSVRVLTEWKQGRTLGTIRVADLSQTGADSKGTYLLPLLEASSGLYRVAPTPPPMRAPLIYSVTPDTLEQLHAILEQSPER